MMGVAVLLLLLLGSAVGFAILVLAMGVGLRRDEKPARMTAVRTGNLRSRPQSRPPQPRDENGAARIYLPVDDSVIERVEEYLASELMLAGEFVSRPSVESLYGRSNHAALFDDTVVAKIERHLRMEQIRATEFVARPSIRRLYGFDDRIPHPAPGR